MPHPLDRFFAPDSIALIGASRDQEKIPGRLLSMLRKNEFPGKIYPVNPNYGDIDGLKCFSSIADVGPRLIATRRRIGIVAQSGGIGFAIYHRARALGIALSYVISAGNESDLGAGEFFEYMVQDTSTDVILLFIEGIRDVDKFLSAARRAAETGKPSS